MAMVKQGTFREDLYYRLKVFPINVPALRQRTEDIPKLVWHFTALHARRMNKRIDEVPSDTMDALVRYRWPGNVRELQNFIERAVILSPHSVLRAPTSELEPFNVQKERICPSQVFRKLNESTFSKRSKQLIGNRRNEWRRPAAWHEANIIGLQDEEASHKPPRPFPETERVDIDGFFVRRVLRHFSRREPVSGGDPSQFRHRK